MSDQRAKAQADARTERGLLFVALAALGWAAVDVFALGQGVIALILCAVGVLYLLPRSFAAGAQGELRRLRLAKALVTIAAGALALGAIGYANQAAERRAGELIAAVETFHSRQGRYPKTLEELVPAFIPAIPAAKPGGVAGSRFLYWESERGHSLMYVAFPPFGRRIYSFEERKWAELD